MASCPPVTFQQKLKKLMTGQLRSLFKNKDKRSKNDNLTYYEF